MNTIKNKLNQCAIKAYAYLTTSDARKAMRGMSCVAMLSLLLMNSAMAADGTLNTIQNGIKDATSQIYSIMTAVIIPVSVAGVAWLGYQLLLGGEKGLAKVKSQGLIILAGIALVWLAPQIVKQASSWFSTNGDAGVFDH